MILYNTYDVDKIVWNMIDTYFKDNPNWIVKHHTDSYDLFMREGIKQIFKEKIHLHYERTRSKNE